MARYSLTLPLFLLGIFLLPLDASAMERLFYYTDDEIATESFYKHADQIDIFAPQVYKLKADGTLSGTLEPELIAHAKKHGVKIMPLVTNENFSNTSHKYLLNDPVIQVIAISTMIVEAKNRGYSGWQFDFEQMDISHKDEYSEFIKRTSMLFRAAGLTTSVAVIAKVSDNPADYPNGLYEKLIGVYDYDSLAASADFVTVMSYDDPTSKGPAVGWGWLNQVLQYSLTHIPREKLSLGLALYYWSRDVSTWKLIGIGGNERIDEIIERGSTAFTYDAVNRMPVMHYVYQGRAYSLWYENGKSMAHKITLIKENELRGFSAWTLGLEVPSTWNVFK